MTEIYKEMEDQPTPSESQSEDPAAEPEPGAYIGAYGFAPPLDNLNFDTKFKYTTGILLLAANARSTFNASSLRHSLLCIGYDEKMCARFIQASNLDDSEAWTGKDWCVAILRNGDLTNMRPLVDPRLRVFNDLVIPGQLAELMERHDISKADLILIQDPSFEPPSTHPPRDLDDTNLRFNGRLVGELYYCQIHLPVEEYSSSRIFVHYLLYQVLHGLRHLDIEQYEEEGGEEFMREAP
ncbi:hypothetical protein LTR66_001153 [Elasticomyces elasticus]|nr:hypothetical protein LTR66_001153 [Elasticomyces elasticus]